MKISENESQQTQFEADNTWKAMNDAPDSISKRNATDQESILKKYTSLLHILNGEEEFTLDQNGFIISSNLEAVNVTGYEEHEIIGKHISVFYQPEDFEKAKADLEKAFRVGSTVVTGVRVKKRQVIFWAKMKIKHISSSQHENGGFLVILQDATHRALSKERIRTLRDEYLAIFNNPFVGTFKFRMDGYAIQMCNQKTLDILKAKHSGDQYLDRFFSSLRQFESFIATLQREKKIEGFKFLVRSSEGNEENWAVISARYFETQGFVEGILLDVTEQYSQMIELQRVNTELDNFIYHASHDLRSPLTTIMGLVNLGVKENSVEVVHSYLKIIQGRIDHLDFLLKDLISVSYNNGISVESEPFYFEDEVHSILKLFKNLDQSFKVTVNISQETDFVTDPVRMRTILRNLLSNSFNYYSPDVAEPSIDLNIRSGSSHCAILLKDNGIGIHPEFKSKVCDMFFRATERSEGSGLGLYIVKSMVEKLSGKISFESTLNVGTTFLITIPNQTRQISFKKDGFNNYFMLTSHQIKLVESSWDYILINSKEAGTIFYEKLFSIAPELRELFKGDINSQSQKLISLITFAVHKLNNFNEIVSDVIALGIRHKGYKVKPEHFPIVGEALLWTLGKGLGDRWNEETKLAWATTYNTLAKTMIEAIQ